MAACASGGPGLGDRPAGLAFWLRVELPLPAVAGLAHRRWSQAWLWLAALTLLGQGASAADEPVHTVVVMVPEASPPVPTQILTEALSSQLAELGVQVQLSTGPAGAPVAADSSSADRDVLAFVWIEGTPDALVVHFYEPAGASLRERRIPVTSTDAASLEEVAVVVRSAASALLERARPASAEPAAPEPAPPPPPPPLREAVQPPPSEPSKAAPVQLSIAYAGELYAAETPWQSGVAAQLAWRPGRGRWLVGAAYSWYPPLDQREDLVTVTLSRHPTELFFGWEAPVAKRRLAFRAEGGLVGDLVVRRTSRVSEPLLSTPSTTRWSWAASTRLRAGWSPTPSWSLFSSAGADFLLNRFENVVDSESETAVISPLRARPRMRVGIAIDIP